MNLDKPQEPKDAIIVALDVSDPAKAIPIAESLIPHVGCVKVGLEVIFSVFATAIRDEDLSPESRFMRFRKLFRVLGPDIFMDGKLHDIPNTVAAASRLIGGMGVRMLNVHALGGTKMMKDAKRAADEGADANGVARAMTLAVTLLTSLSHKDLEDVGMMHARNIHDDEERAKVLKDDVGHFVRNLAWHTQENGLDGIICSPQEIRYVREYCQPELRIITPGIRASDAPPDDQKRTMTAYEAILAGSDYLVMGRPILDTPDPVEAAKRTAEEIGKAMVKRKKEVV